MAAVGGAIVGDVHHVRDSGVTAPAAEVLDFAAEATAIDDARTAVFDALRAANARGLDGADVDALDEARARIAARCERLRREFYPRWGQLAVVNGAALVISKTGRSWEIVWRRAERR
ncbi:hypothetical protein [Nocardia vaccinii]|uniref:hypothetical protein n=1 Tax=Nocardia vaccinii TaxID=1822 RepID=UPI00082D06D4|nr:hypothetical protein [Nocardia vaccinii]